MLGTSIEVDIAGGKISFTLRSTANNFAKLLALFDVLLTAPTFSAKELRRVKHTALNQLHQAKEDSKSIALDELRNSFYGYADRKYTYSIDESMAEVPKVTTAGLKKLHQRVRENQWFCTIGGNKKTVSSFEIFLKKRKSTSAQPDGVHQPRPPKASLHLQNITSRQNIDLSIGTPLPITRSHPDFIPLSFAIAVLGKWGVFAGRLMSTVREKEGLTYGIYAQLEGFSSDEQGYLRIMTFFAPDKVVQGLSSTFREIKKLAQSGVSKSEVEAFKTILTTQQSLVKDSFTRMIFDLHRYHCEGFTLAEIEIYKQALSEVSRADINRTIKTYIIPSLMSVSAAGPTTSVQKDLQKWFKSI